MEAIRQGEEEVLAEFAPVMLLLSVVRIESGLVRMSLSIGLFGFDLGV